MYCLINDFRASTILINYFEIINTQTSQKLVEASSKQIFLINM